MSPAEGPAAPKQYAHDVFGSRIYAGPTPYSTIKTHVYDDSNRLKELRDPTTGALVASYLYDAVGRRVKKTWGTAESLFFYDSAGHTIETVYLNPSTDDLVKDAVFLQDELVGGVARWGDIGTAAEIAPILGHREIDRFLHGTAEAVPLRVLVVSASGLVLLALLPRRRRAKAATLAVALVVAGPNVDCDTTTPPQFYWVHGDHLGTPLAMTDTPATPASAKVVWRAKYEPFGLATVDQDPDGDTVLVTNDYRFPGQIYDYESGLHYNYARDYDPFNGRYAESEPGRAIAPLLTWNRLLASTSRVTSLGSTLSGLWTRRLALLATARPIPNNFAYVGGRPTTWYDSSGRGPVVGATVCIVAAAAIGIYEVAGTVDFGDQIAELKARLQFLEWVIEYANEHCWPPEQIADLELERLNVVADLGRSQAGATVQGALTAAAWIGGGAACGIALALPSF